MKNSNTIIVEKINVDISSLFKDNEVDMANVYEWLLNDNNVHMPEEARRKLKNALRKEKINRIKEK